MGWLAFWTVRISVASARSSIAWAWAVVRVEATDCPQAALDQEKIRKKGKRLRTFSSLAGKGCFWMEIEFLCLTGAAVEF
jgi:hypothetical protein